MRGISLLETVVALLLLLLLLSCVTVLSFSLGAEKSMGMELLAMHQAVGMLDACRQDDPATVPSGDWDAAANTPPTSLGGGIVFPPAPYPTTTCLYQVNGTWVRQSVSFHVTSAPALERDGVTPMADLRALACTVTWRTGSTTRHAWCSTAMTGGGL